MSYYDVLGVSQYASPDEVKSSFRKLALKYHPDICKLPDATKRFQQINEAYLALIEQNIGRREWYDAFDLKTLQDYFDLLGYVYGSREFIRHHAREAYEEWLKRQAARERKRRRRKEG